MKVKATIQGGAQLAANLAKLVHRLDQQALYRVLLESGEPIRTSASQNAPRGDEPPHIADNIGMRPVLRGELASVVIGPVRGFAYGLPLEIGSVDTAPQPFLRPAFDSESPRSVDIAAKATWRELNAAGHIGSIGDVFPDDESGE
jgi:HK97 gp10 family phage protein